MKKIKFLAMPVFFFLISCSQPADPSYTGPVIENIYVKQVFLAGIPCSLKVYVSDEKNSAISLRSVSEDDTSQWSGAYGSNQDFFHVLNAVDTGFNFVRIQAKNTEDLFSSWSDPIVFYSAIDTVYFSEDFNTQDTFLDTSVWVVGTAGNAFAKIGDKDQKRAAVFYDPEISSSWVTAYAYVPLADSGIISFSVYLNSFVSQSEDNIISFRTLPSDWSWSKRGMHFGIVSDTLCYKTGNDWKSITGLSQGQWNDIEISYNTLDARYFFRLNGALISSVINFDGTGENNVIFQILCPDNAFRDSTWFDDVRFIMY